MELLSKTFRRASKAGGSDTEVIDALERLCVEMIDLADIDTRDEIVTACDNLREMVSDGMSATEAMAGCRASAAQDKPVGPGLHLLTGHKGKGQEFDWVFVLGLEDGHIPDFRSTTGEQLEEELRVLHVMVSRARYGVVFTHSRSTPTQFGPRRSDPSQWLEPLRATATAFDHI
ncbi:MAG TPA: 3'-5' exonuclease [Acidimicrobiia bacterium]|nr:3'-5' exonuclease [Acidimicrobiia bacterium]